LGGHGTIGALIPVPLGLRVDIILVGRVWDEGSTNLGEERRGEEREVRGQNRRPGQRETRERLLTLLVFGVALTEPELTAATFASFMFKTEPRRCKRPSTTAVDSDRPRLSFFHTFCLDMTGPKGRAVHGG